MSKGNILGHGSGADEEETDSETEYVTGPAKTGHICTQMTFQ